MIRNPNPNQMVWKDIPGTIEFNGEKVPNSNSKFVKRTNETSWISPYRLQKVVL